MIYDMGFGPYCISFNLQRNWWLKGGTENLGSAMQAVWDWAFIKTLDTKGSGEFSWLAMQCAVSHIVTRRRKHPTWLYKGGLTGSSAFRLLLSSALDFPSCGWFDWYAFSLINCNYEYKSCQWVLCIFLENYQNRGWFLEPPKLALGVT